MNDDVRTVLQDPMAQELIGSGIPARLGYTGIDDAPRVVPMNFHWTGSVFVMGTVVTAYKVRSLRANPKVALTVDTADVQPPKSLLVRGTATVEIVDGVPETFLDGYRKVIPGEWFDGFEAQMRGLYDEMAVITVAPAWATLIDFQSRPPQELGKLIAQRMGAA